MARRQRQQARRLRSTDHTSGFSLIELIIAIGITLGMAAIMVGIVTNLLDTAQRSQGSLVADNQARAALNFIAQDLQSVVLIPDGKSVCLVATVQPDQTGEGDAGAGMADWDSVSGGPTKPGVGTPGAPDSSLQLDPPSEALEDYRFGMAGVWLRLLTTEPDKNDSDVSNYSVPRAISYQIVRYFVQDGGSLRYGLFRSFVRPDDVFNYDYSFLYDGSGTNSMIYNNPADASPTPGAPESIRTPNRTLLLANNVIDFGVRFWKRENDGSLTLLFPATSAGEPSNNNGGFAAWAAPLADFREPPEPDPWEPTTGSTMVHGFPDVADIFLRVLTDDGAKELEAFERDQIAGTTWWALALKNSKVFTRRVEIRGKVM